jgi:hypothetical protein
LDMNWEVHILLPESLVPPIKNKFTEISIFKLLLKIGRKWKTFLTINLCMMRHIFIMTSRKIRTNNARM